MSRGHHPKPASASKVKADDCLGSWASSPSPGMGLHNLATGKVDTAGQAKASARKSSGWGLLQQNNSHEVLLSHSNVI